MNKKLNLGVTRRTKTISNDLLSLSTNVADIIKGTATRAAATVRGDTPSEAQEVAMNSRI